MTAPDHDTAPTTDGTDVSVAPDDLDTGETPATSTAEEYREHDETLGGTGGLDAGGAG